MSSRTIHWTRRAVRRLAEIGAYIATDNSAAASRVVSRILTAVEALATQPAMGRAGRIKNTRELVFADIPYIVAYRIKKDQIEILTVLHAARKWPTAF